MPHYMTFVKLFLLLLVLVFSAFYGIEAWECENGLIFK